MTATETSGTGSRRGLVGLRIAAVLCVVAVVAAAFYGISWAYAAASGSSSKAAQRDEALRVGRSAVVNFNTLDYREVDKGLDLWAASSTGQLHDEVEKGRQENAKRIKESKTRTEGKVLDAAITNLDEQAGKAHMIAVVKVTVTPEGQQPVEKSVRYQGDLSREGEQWKLSALGPVPDK